MSRWTAQGEGGAGAALDFSLSRQRHLRCAVRRLPGASGDRGAAVEAVIAAFAVQAGGFDAPQGASRPGVGQQVTVGVEFGPAGPGTFEEVEVIAAVDTRDRVEAEILRRFDGAEVLLLHPRKHMVGTGRHLEAGLELPVDEFATTVVQVVIVRVDRQHFVVLRRRVRLHTVLRRERISKTAGKAKRGSIRPKNLSEIRPSQRRHLQEPACWRKQCSSQWRCVG
ncbi:hypothetical protein D3C86_1602890 [compost metagenome]